MTTVLFDLGSTFEALGPEHRRFLSGDDEEYQSFRRGLRAAQGSVLSNAARLRVSKYVAKAAREHSAPLRWLGAIVSYDRIAADAHLLEYVYGRRAFAPLRPYLDLIQPLRISDDVRQKAQAAIAKNRPGVRMVSATMQTVDSGWFPGDKYVHELLRNTRWALCGSNDSLERGLFYLEVANSLGVPLVVTRNKEYSLRQFGRRLRRLVHERLSSAALRSRPAAPVHDEFHPAPPLAEMMIARSLHDGLSPMEGCLELRATPEARAYRALIRRLTDQFDGAFQDRREATDALGRIRTLMSSWALGRGVRRRVRRVHLSEIPLAGWIAKLLSMRTIKIADIQLGSIDKAHVFVSSWFKPVV